MKSIIIVVLLLCVYYNTSAQVVDSANLPPYLKTKQLPNFKLLKTDSVTFFYKNNLNQNKPTVFVVFNTECGHCILETKRIVDSIAFLKNVQIVFLSVAKMGDIKKFAALNKVDTIKNITVCQDTRNFFGYFFNIKKAPFVAVYNKNYTLNSVYENDSYVLQLYNTIKKMGNENKKK